MNELNWKQELNSAQLRAVESIEGPHLIIAGAGSGKTRVLVYRVAYLVQKGVQPNEILLLTFTRKAAQEMLNRASLLLDDRCQKVAGGTFHSFANTILRKYAACLCVSSNFTILDQGDAEDVVNLIRTQLGYYKSKEQFPRKKVLLELISKSVNKSEDIEFVLDAEYPQFMDYLGDINKIRDEYIKYKQKMSLFDYDDLLVYLKKLLAEHSDIRSLLSRKYKYIMVDEYQDTNKLQASIVYFLAAEHKNIMVVGDDSQSIYSFRGANFKNIIEIPRVFKEVKIITLEENYRSTQPILNLTNEVIRSAKEKFEKKLFTKKKGNKLPVYVDVQDESLQVKYVADKICEFKEKGTRLSDIAVLFRFGWHSNELEIELASRNIPFIKYGGQRFVEAAHIKDIISYLRIVYNLSDTVSWYRVLLLIRGVGPKMAEKIIAGVNANKKDFEIDEKLAHKSEYISKLFGLLKKTAAEHDNPVGMIQLFIEYYQPLLRDKYDDFNKRLNDFDSLKRIAAKYNSLEQFLADMALDPPERNILDKNSAEQNESSLTLSTIHSAKGLEWQTVFLLYLCEGHLPSYQSLENTDALEEERRLFYVAVTRAKENLFLLKPNIERYSTGYSRRGQIFSQPSRFLEERDILSRFVDLQTVCGAETASEFDAVGLEDIF